MPLSRVLLVCAAALAAGPASAADKPNALTPKEIADGWLMLFDGETTFGWKVEGDAAVKDGKLVVGGPKDTKLTTTTAFPAGTLQVRRVVPGATVPSTVEQAAPAGPVVIDVPAGRPLVIERAVFRPAGLKPMFNGKDLSGWKVFADPKRAATKFEVTPAGELSAKNGPGDLQTDGQYADFVLQLECKTNGKALNSGVFFRCLPDQYQQGYEAQIQNAYAGDDRTKPVDFGTGAIYRRVPARKVVSNDNEWFTLTLVAHGPHFATWVNGYQTVDWTDDRKAADNARQGLKTGKGHLSIQGHDPTTDLLFRNIRIAELPAAK